MTQRRLLILTALCVLPVALPAQEPGKVATKHFEVRKWNVMDSASTTLRPLAVVEEVDEKSMTISQQLDNDYPAKKWTLYPSDRMADGKLAKGADGAYAYRWADVKKGDRVKVWVAFDDGEQQWYAFGFSIERRPGAKIPESQDAKNDTRYEKRSLLNDIDNGEDVSEEEITRLFPAAINPPSGKLVRPGGLPEDARKKLQETRAKLEEKKEKELKAKPPEKKDDKK